MKNKLKLIFILSTVLSLVLVGCSQKPQNEEVIFQVLDAPTEQAVYERDVVYKTGRTGKELDFNIAIPKEASADNKKPLVVCLHPGSWVGGDKDSLNDALYTLSYYGYAAATVNYGLIPGESMISQVENVVEAVEFIAENYQDKGIDKDKIVIMGASAGGHLATLAAQEISSNKSDYDFTLAYLIDMFGPTDLTYYDNLDEEASEGLVDLSKTISYFKNHVDYLVEDEADSYEGAMDIINPIAVVDNSLVKTLVITGDKDSYVPKEVSKEFYDRLDELGVEATYIEVEGVDHQPLNEQLWEQVYKQLESNLK